MGVGSTTASPYLTHVRLTSARRQRRASRSALGTRLGLDSRDGGGVLAEKFRDGVLGLASRDGGGVPWTVLEEEVHDSAAIEQQSRQRNVSDEARGKKWRDFDMIALTRDEQRRLPSPD